MKHKNICRKFYSEDCVTVLSQKGLFRRSSLLPKLWHSRVKVILVQWNDSFKSSTQRIFSSDFFEILLKLRAQYEF